MFVNVAVLATKLWLSYAYQIENTRKRLQDNFVSPIFYDTKVQNIIF